MGDWFDSAVDTVTGIFSGAGDALGSAANWTTQNPGAANLLGRAGAHFVDLLAKE